MLADDQQMAAVLSAEGGGGQLVDGHRLAQPGPFAFVPRLAVARLQQVGQRRVATDVGVGVALEDHRRSIRRPRPGQLADAVQVLLALRLAEPDDLERVVALDQAVGVVVDRLAGPRQQAGGGVVVAEDQVGVGLAALQGDAHRHLIDGAAHQAVGAAERLRAEQDVDAEGPALPDQAVEQLGRFLGDLVILDEELLKLVHHQQDAQAARACGSASR